MLFISFCNISYLQGSNGIAGRKHPNKSGLQGQEVTEGDLLQEVGQGFILQEVRQQRLVVKKAEKKEVTETHRQQVG